ncbi:DUF1707 SHOCT-like domain-containing protein [Actinomadura viridis]|uniref:DUF1707 domain-containing protein n=1 Tax=Actinomadura viridis TaxID=58110 RepID=A0A931DRD4_9ACTN|nr:DUF1707 domain-containing protein [Actinomadura viridis]MBG6092396.1 hypothetical protein [Actinomadura viridis]
MTAAIPDPARQPDLRVSHAERDAVVEQLREAAAEGRLEIGELETRLEQALTAKTYGDLVPLTADLPPVATPNDGKPLVLKGGVHGATRNGRWQVPARITAHGGVGGVKLDFTRTQCGLREVEIEAHGEMAGVTIVIPDDWAADTGGLEPGLGGLKDKTTDDRRPGTPLIRLSGNGGPAGVVIRHPNKWERRKLKRNPPQ